MQEITSKTNANIKHVHRLTVSSKFRSSENSFVLEGARLCEEAVNASVNIKKAFYTQSFYNKNLSLVQKIVISANESFVISDNILSLISDTESPQGIVCECEFLNFNKNNFDKSICRVIVLEDVRNPSNMGNIMRTCEALGVDGLFLAGNCCDVYNPKVLRGSMGSVFRMNIIFAADANDAVSNLKNRGFCVYGAIPSGKALTLGKFDFAAKSAVILGNEGNGLTNLAKSLCDFSVNIPMNPKAESLSVASAAAVIAWEMTNGGNGNG